MLGLSPQCTVPVLARYPVNPANPHSKRNDAIANAAARDNQTAVLTEELDLIDHFAKRLGYPVTFFRCHADTFNIRIC